MKTTLLDSYISILKYYIKQFIEALLRLILFMIPLGVYHFLLQMKSKPTKITSIGAYFTDNSTFMFASPGVIICTVNGNLYKEFFNKKKRSWEKNHRTYLTVLRFIFYIVGILYFTIHLFV